MVSRVETPKPDCERARTWAIEIFEDRQLSHGNIEVTIGERGSWRWLAAVSPTIRGRCRELPFRSRIRAANRRAAGPTGAILVRIVAVPVSDRKGLKTYHNSYHNPGFGLIHSPVTR